MKFLKSMAAMALATVGLGGSSSPAFVEVPTQPKLWKPKPEPKRRSRVPRTNLERRGGLTNHQLHMLSVEGGQAAYLKLKAEKKAGIRRSRHVKRKSVEAGYGI